MIKIIESIIIFLVLSGAATFVGWSFFFQADEHVRSDARLLRFILKDLLRLSDDTIDKHFQNPLNTVLGDQPSEIVSQGVKEPKKLDGTVTYIRVIGFFILATVFCSMVMFAYALLTGKPITINVP